MAAPSRGLAKPALEPRGGHRQKRQWATMAASESQPASSELAKVLITSWAWGDMSAPQVQKFAAAAKADGLTHPDIAKLAALGSGGRHAGNCHRELVNKLQPTFASQALSQVTLYFKQPPARISGSIYDVMLPHELFAVMFQHHRDFFVEQLCGGSVGNLPSFWKAMANHPVYDQHPMKQLPNHENVFIPLSIHGDGVPVSGVSRSWAKSAEVHSWSSLLCKSSTLKSTYLMFFFYSALVVKTENLDASKRLSKMLAWSLLWLFRGVWPETDVNGAPFDKHSPEGKRAGQQLAGGFRGVLWAIKGDLDHMSKAFGFPYANQAGPCGLCRANQTDKPWTDARPGVAQWLSTIWTNQAHKAAHAQRHPVFDLPGSGVQMFYPDIMHTMHLGTYQYFLGSVLKLLTHRTMSGTHENNLSRVWVKIKEAYTELGSPSRFNDLKMTMYNKNDHTFPLLKGKASELRHFPAALRVAFKAFMKPDDTQHKQVLVMLDLCIKMEGILDDYSGEYVFPAKIADEFFKCTVGFVQLNQSLGHFYHPKRIVLFNTTIKFHYMVHIGLLAKTMNPRMTWCYSGEDFMKKTKHIIQSCLSGATPAAACPKAMRKYTHGLGLEMSNGKWRE